MKKNYLFEVIAKKEIDTRKNIIPEGSLIYVKEELKRYYKGTWSSMFGTYNVKVPKDKCIKLDNL